MDAETGLLRIARVVEILGMLWGGLYAIGSLVALVFVQEGDDKWFLVGAGVVIGAIGYGIARAVAWVVKGFAQSKA